MIFISNLTKGKQQKPFKPAKTGSGNFVFIEPKKTTKELLEIAESKAKEKTTIK